MKTIYAKSRPGRRGYSLPTPNIFVDCFERSQLPPELMRKDPAELPEVAEVEVMRHFTNLSRQNFGVEVGTYPLGSCTMKYNPKFTEQAARLPGFVGLHPLLPQLRRGGLLTQGALRVLYDCERLLAEITGMSAFTMQPLAGAHGELTGHHCSWPPITGDKGNDKSIVLVPDSAHGTNPGLGGAIAGYEVVSVPSKDGVMDPAAFKGDAQR